MSYKTNISTTTLIYPQIYAYITPNYPKNEGWIKIGHTIHQDVDIRIKQQTQTADLDFETLWYKPAQFVPSGEIFSDKQFHAFLRKHKNIEQRPNKEWFFYNGTPNQALIDFDDFRHSNFNQAKENLEYQLRTEQQEAIRQTLDYIKNNPNGEFLWNAKPRFGKTLSTYDLARQLNAQKVLIVTNRPAIANSWFDDFETFIAWQTDFAFVSDSESLKDRPVLTRDDFLKQTASGKNRMMAFISLQNLKGATLFGGKIDKSEKLDWVKQMTWDLLVIDESHEGVDTDKTEIAFDEIDRHFTLHLSGTPFRALAKGDFSQDAIYNWTYADEQAAKANWTNIEENNPYERLPCLNLFSYQMSKMIVDEVNQGANINGEDIDFAFDLNEFFETNDQGKLLHEKEVKKWLDTLARNEKYPFSTKELRNELKHTFWLLNRVASAKALQKLLQAHPVFENYEIILAAGDGRTNDNDPISNQKSLERVKAAIAKHDKTITLSVGQLTTGITIPQWTAVLMLSNLKSPSLYMQAAFRAQNPWTYVIDGQPHQKENAYVFDFAPERTLIIYDEFANNLSPTTSNGGGTSHDRKDNIKQLLNFFPVIAEDDNGKMIALDVNQVLTIPNTLKAREVVQRGFMSNFLFQNVSRIFTSNEAREILEQLNPVDVGKTVPRTTEERINTQNVAVDENGDVVVAQEIIIAQTQARFGAKVYADIVAAVDTQARTDTQNLSAMVAKTYTQNTQETVKALAKEHGLSTKAAEQVVQQSANAIAREVEIVQKKAEIKHAEAKIEYQRDIAQAQHNPAQIKAAKAAYEAKQQQIEQDFKQQVTATVEEKSKDLVQQSTQTILEKAEDNKKNYVEDDVRARLRGFARTIPSFLMAYGTANTTLANFDSTINDTVFHEVTGITLDQFRILRDTYHFFDETVFNQSVQEFLNKRTVLANYFDESQQEDIFDYIPPQQTNQIFTPKKVVKLMIDKLEAEDPTLFKDPHKTFADLYVKSGLYLTEIVKRLYVGLADKMPDPDARLTHILEQQVYGFAPSEIIFNIARNFVFGFDEEMAKNINHAHIVCLDTTPYAKGEGDFVATCQQQFKDTQLMKFDVVVGNPPYQENNDDRNRDDAIYPYFYELAEKVSDKYCLISPARFLFGIGSTNADWNQKMLSDKSLKVVHFNQNSSEVFANTDIKGGVAVLYRDTNTSFGEIGTFTAFSELNSILSKVSKITDFTNNFGDLMYVQTKFNLDVLYKDYPHFQSRLGSDGKERRLVSSTFDLLPEIYFDKKQNNQQVQIYGRQNNDRIYKWVNQHYLEIDGNFNGYKVFVPAANGSGAIGEVLSTPLIGAPLIGHTQTFISIGNFDNEYQAQSLLKYLKTKFSRTMLGIKKTTQNNKTKETWSKVPLQDFTANSDIDWTQSITHIDQQLYKKYGLNPHEIEFIEEKVKAMD